MSGQGDQSTAKFLITQKMIQDKNKEYMENLDKKREKDALQARFAAAKISHKTNSLWEVFKTWLKLK